MRNDVFPTHPAKRGNRPTIGFLLAAAMGLLLPLMGLSRPAAPQGHFDVVVYGATPAGIAAAVNAAKQGLKVGLFEETDHIGGLVSSGLSNTDFKTFEAVQGTYRDFMNRIVAYYAEQYGNGSQQVNDCYHGAWYEPKAALAVFKQMLAEQPGISVYLGHRLAGVVTVPQGNNRKISSLKFARPKGMTGFSVVSAKVCIDATYEGDLMAAAGCAYAVGREPRAQYGELFAGKIYYDGSRFLPGSTGEGDKHIQCYNFRICMTTDSMNQVRVPKPDNYDRNEYTYFLKRMQHPNGKEVLDSIVKFRPIPNGKADINDFFYSNKSLRLPGENYGWPEGDAATRAAIFKRHKDYSIGLFYFLQNDPEVPGHVRNEANRWALPKDEFQAYGHFPPMLYVREGRRLLGKFVLTEKDTQPVDSSVRSPVYADAIAVCDYSLDSHGCSPGGGRYPDISEGVFNYAVQPFQIPYRCMLPIGVEGLLVPVALSASHVGYSAVRMEPVWTDLGQAAGLAAVQAVKQHKKVSDIQVSQLQSAIHEGGGITVYLSDVLPGSPYFSAAQYLGTRGYFHYLPEYRQVNYASRGKTLMGQWLHAYKNHAVSPEKKMDAELLQQWLLKAGINGKGSNGSYLAMTRGEFLNWLYRQIVAHN